MEYFVNNVNVTKCEFYIPETAPNEDGDEFLDVCNFPNLYNSFCEENKNCWYKQLQRIKTECEQYKKSKQASYEAMQEQWNNAINENRLLKSALKNKNLVAIAEENEKLKSENNELKIHITALTDLRTQDFNLKIKKENMLKEIKELCDAWYFTGDDRHEEILELIKELSNE